MRGSTSFVGRKDSSFSQSMDALRLAAATQIVNHLPPQQTDLFHFHVATQTA
jgi:hypothetical protein